MVEFHLSEYKIQMEHDFSQENHFANLLESVSRFKLSEFLCSSHRITQISNVFYFEKSENPANIFLDAACLDYHAIII